MSVTTIVGITIQSYHNMGGVVRWSLDSYQTGDASGGSYLWEITAPPTLNRVHPGTNFFCWDFFDFYANGVLVTPYAMVVLYPRNLQLGRIGRLFQLETGALSASSEGVIKSDMFPSKNNLGNLFIPMDEVLEISGASPIMLAQARITPNTLGVNAGCNLSGLIVDERYIEKHGLYF